VRFPRVFPRARRAWDRAAWAALDAGGRAPRAAFLAAALRRHPDLPLTCEELWEFLAPRVLAGSRAYPGAAAWLRAAARRFPVALVTNGGSARQREKAARAGLLVPGVPVLVSQDLCRPKPDPALLLSALERLGVPPSRALLVGDDPTRDGVAAARAGVAFRRVLPGRALDQLPGPSWTRGRAGAPGQSSQTSSGRSPGSKRAFRSREKPGSSGVSRVSSKRCSRKSGRAKASDSLGRR